MKRVIFDIILFLSVFLLPYWVTAVLVICGIFLFVHFYEFLIAGVIMYSVYMIPTQAILAQPIWFATVLALVYVGIQILRRYIILYKS